MPPGGNVVMPSGGNQPGGGMAGRMNVTFDRKNVGSHWPLIRVLLDDAVHGPRYIAALKKAATLTSPDALASRIKPYADALAPYGGTSYPSAITSLNQAIRTRHTELTTFLAST